MSWMTVTSIMLAPNQFFVNILKIFCWHFPGCLGNYSLKGVNLPLDTWTGDTEILGETRWPEISRTAPRGPWQKVGIIHLWGIGYKFQEGRWILSFIGLLVAFRV